MISRPIRIIGIDPGLRRTGWGVIESEGVRLSYVASGLIVSDSEDDLAYRLRALHEGRRQAADPGEIDQIIALVEARAQREKALP